MADKYKIMSDATMGIFDQHELDITGLSNGVDEYMKITCLELLDYIVNHVENHWKGDNGKSYFMVNGRILSKEELFENFL